MRWENRRVWKKILENVCSGLLALILLMQTGLIVAAGTNEVVKDSGTEECVDIQLPVEKQQQFVSEDEVISVSMPLKTPFTMNPTMSFGEEQIWSPVFHFQNNSQTAVQVTIKNIRYVLKENSTVITHYQPFDGLEERKKKEIYLCLRFGETEVSVGDLSREHCFTLAKANEGAGSGREFSIDGMMSCFPEQEWQDGDVSIAFQVEYKAVPEIQTAAEKTTGDTAAGGRSENNQTLMKDQGSSEKPEIFLTEAKNTEWQKNLIGAVLSEKEPVSANGTGEGAAEDKAQAGAGEKKPAGAEDKSYIRAYIIDSGRREQGADAAAQKEAPNTIQKAGAAEAPNTIQKAGAAEAPNTVQKANAAETLNTVQKANAASNAAAGEQTAADAEFSFDWKKILDEYAKYADAIPEEAVLLLDVNEKAENPAAYVTKEGLEGLALDMENAGAVYTFWRNPDYVPEENKVWHIEDDVPYYISNLEQPWLWSADDKDVPSDAEPVFLWIQNEDRTQSRADASQQTYQDIQKKEGNAEYGPGNDTGDTAAE